MSELSCCCLSLTIKSPFHDQWHLRYLSLPNIKKMCLFIKALGVDTEDDIYLLSNYFLKGPGEGEQAQEGSEKGAKDEEMAEGKEGREETSGGVDEGEKKDDEGSVVFSVDEKASDSSSVKAHLSGNEAVVLIVVCTQPLSHLSIVQQIHTTPHPPPHGLPY